MLILIKIILYYKFYDTLPYYNHTTLGGFGKMIRQLARVARGAYPPLISPLSTDARIPASYVRNNKAEMNSKLLAISKEIPLYGRLELGFPLGDKNYDINITNTLKDLSLIFMLDLKPRFS